MESTTSGHRASAGRRCNAGMPAGSKARQVVKGDPRWREIDRSNRSGDYASFAGEVLRDLNPRGPLERLAANHVVHSAWTLKGSLEKHAVRHSIEKIEPAADSSRPRARRSELDLASRSMREALESLDFLRTRSRIVRDHPFNEADDATDILSNEWPIVPCDEVDHLTDDHSAPPEADQEEEKVPNWHERLVFDFDVSDSSPVVKGTWVTVGHIVSLVVDGWTWADILRSYPELTEDDIRTCVAYAVAEEHAVP